MIGARVFVRKDGRTVAAVIVRRWPAQGLRRDQPVARPFYLVEFADGERRVYDLEQITVDRKEQSHV